MSELLRWISPFDPRGMSVYGSLVVAGLSVGLWSVSGTLTEIWPHRCSIFKAQLLRNAESTNHKIHHLNVIAQTVSDPNQLNLWEIKSQAGQGSWFIPHGNYVEARVSSQLLAPVFLELFTQSGSKVVAYLRPDYQAFEIYTYLIGTQRHTRSKNTASLPALQSSESIKDLGISPQQLWGSKLNHHALSIAPEQVTCHPDQTHQEVIDVLALILKHADQGLERAWILASHSRLSEYRSKDGVRRRIYRTMPAKQPYQWVWFWEASHHLSTSSTPETVQPWVVNLLKDLDQVALQPQRIVQHKSEHIIVSHTRSLSAQLFERKDE